MCFVIVKSCGFALFGHFSDHILIIQDSTKLKFFILFISFFPHSNFHSKVQRFVVV